MIKIFDFVYLILEISLHSENELKQISVRRSTLDLFFAIEHAFTQRGGLSFGVRTIVTFHNNNEMSPGSPMACYNEDRVEHFLKTLKRKLSYSTRLSTGIRTKALETLNS